MASGPITWWQIDGETMETVKDLILGGSKITADGDCSHEIKKTLVSWKKSNEKPRPHIKKQRHYFAYKGPYSQSDGFSSCHVWELDNKKGWALKNGCFGRTDAEAEAAIFWPPDVKNWLTGKDSDAG